MSVPSRNTAAHQTQGQARILLLDDDPVSARLVRAALPEPLYRVTWASDLGRACDFLITEAPDLVLVRLELHRSSGLEFLSYLRSTPRGRRTPVVMMSMTASESERQRSFELGADRLLAGILQPRHLRRLVNELLQSRAESLLELSLTAAPTRWNELLFDPTTRVASLALVFGQYRDLIARGESIAVFCIEIEPLFRLGERESWESFDLIRREFVRGLQVVLSGILGNDVVVAISHPGSNDFYCFSRNAVGSSIQELSRTLERESERLLRRIDVDPALAEEVAVFVGGTICSILDTGSPAVLYNAVREAKDLAGRKETRYLHALGERLHRAIKDRAIISHYQPIVDLASGRIIGHEALSRGPHGSDIEKPDVIFDLARDFRLVWDLQALCIRNVEPILDEVCDAGLLFFNLEASFILEMQQRGTEVLRPFLSCGDRVVLEVTERGAIRDFATFRRGLHELKQMGFMIAIDDCGSGYATLEAVAELKPNYLKVGHSLFHGVETDPVRRRIVELVARCADTIDAVSVAEAIETEEQLSVCRDLDIELGQGFIFARPAPWDALVREREMKTALRHLDA
ncbi:MAG TPA: EAL domain-containing response regulator [Thermoanaerobaculia bacterium]|nr:EAL domain-containing response regulator [Thermoanaerobaculia bacterium]